MSPDGPDNPSSPESTHSVPRTALGDLNEPRIDAAFFLVALDDDRDGRWIELGETPAILGRDRQVAVILADAQISRFHSFACVEEGAVVVEDLGSTNGTFVDGRRITGRTQLPPGAILTIGPYSFRCERRPRRDMERAEAHRRDVDRAAGYVASLLPPPLTDGPVTTEWMFRPSEHLGGDALGYEWIDDETFVMFVLDVSGHGVTAAMHSVSVLNVLRQRALAGTDLHDPAGVLTRLNAMFPMERHHDQYFTMWYGVYSRHQRMLSYASAGHHPGYLVSAENSGEPLPLRTSSPMIGAIEDAAFRTAAVSIPAPASLYLFSDGAFEVPTRSGRWRVDDFAARLHHDLRSADSECERLYSEVREACGQTTLDDDFSLLIVTFP